MPGIHRKRAASYFTADMGAGLGAVVSSTQQPIRDPSSNTRAGFFAPRSLMVLFPMRLRLLIAWKAEQLMLE
jgi:hypothetical protein